MDVKGTSLGTSDASIQAAISATYIDEFTEFSCESPVNAMSIDVEEHFQVSAFENQINRNQWHGLSSRVSANTDRILQILNDNDSSATFFTLGWIAEKYPGLIRRIVDAGHELASHGFDHSRVWTQTPAEFRADVERTRKILENVSGKKVTGYRAPSFSIGEKTPWAHDVLHEAGYEYSSSIYPIRHDHYGMPGAPRFPFRLIPEGILEIPLATTSVAGRILPAAGGGYFRLLPLVYSKWAIRRINGQEQMPAAFYFHPWEIDPKQPRMTGVPLSARFRHYVNLNRFEERLRSMLGAFKWHRMDQVFGSAIRPS